MKPLLFLLMAALCARATDTNWPKTITVTNNGIIYKDAEVLKVELDSIIVIQDGGGGRIKLRDLPKELQQRFGYGPAAARAYEAEKESARLARVRYEEIRRQNEAAYKRAVERSNQVYSFRYVIEGKAFQKVPEGVLIFSGELAKERRRLAQNAMDRKILTYNPRNPNASGPDPWPALKAAYEEPDGNIYPDLCLLTDYDLPAGASEDTVIRVHAWIVGDYDYKSTRGFNKSVRKFSTDRRKWEALHPQ